MDGVAGCTCAGWVGTSEGVDDVDWTYLFGVDSVGRGCGGWKWLLSGVFEVAMVAGFLAGEGDCRGDIGGAVTSTSLPLAGSVEFLSTVFPN